ncbi:MAG: RsmE family RNA methyltransferase [Armatimonadota bacterium]
MSSIPYLWVPDLPSGTEPFELPEEVGRHVAGVLRMRAGEPLHLFNGLGAALACVLLTVHRDRATVRSVGPALGAPEPPVRIWVSQALPKQAAKLESVLQHGTELGAAGFRVFSARRSVAVWEPAKRSERIARCRRIVVGAAEQSHRTWMPEVEWSDRGPFQGTGLAVILHESAQLPLESLLGADPRGEITLAVGPEGGFTNDEVEQWTAAGAHAVHLGPRILRTETAALAALSRILARCGQ